MQGTKPNQERKEVQNLTTHWIYQMIDYANNNIDENKLKKNDNKKL